MKKAEAKTGSNVKTATSAAKTVKSSKETKGSAMKSRTVKAVKPEPTIEEITRKAYEIYNQRISRGETGSQTDDWHKAVELLKKG